MMALESGKKEILEILLRCPRVDLNLRNSAGDTPLMWAIKENRRTVLKLLFKCPRVDFKMKDKNGNNLLQIAQKIGKNFFIKFIEKSAVVFEATSLETEREKDIDDLVKFVEGEKETKPSKKIEKEEKQKQGRDERTRES